MKYQDNSLKKILVVTVIVCILFSLIYEKKEAYHECCGGDCPICAMLHVTRDLLNTIKAIIVYYIEILVIPVIVVHTLYRMVILRRQRTLITLKVKLRN